MALKWKKWVLKGTGLEKKQKETAPLKQFHLFPNLAQELQDMVWDRHKNGFEIVRHCFGFQDDGPVYGALDIKTGMFFDNLLIVDHDDVIDPRALKIKGKTIVSPRTSITMCCSLYGPPVNERGVDIWDLNQTKEYRARGKFRFWADFGNDVFFFHFEASALHGPLGALDEPFHNDLFTREISWEDQIQKLAVRERPGLSPFENLDPEFKRELRQICPGCFGDQFTPFQEDILSRFKSLRVLYLIVAFNPKCHHGRPYTWGDDVVDLANDGFMPIDEFRKMHLKTVTSTGVPDCECDLENKPSLRLKEDVEKFFKNLEEPREVEVRVVVDPYGG